MNLGLGQPWIDEGPGVVNVEQTQELDLAEGNIHLHLGEGAAKVERVVFHVGSCLSGQMDGMVEALKRLRGQLAQRHQNTAISNTDNLTVPQGQIGWALPGENLGLFENTVF